MYGILDHSAAEILRQLIVDLGLGTNIANNQPWPVFATGEPDSPEKCITVFDTTSQQDGRSMHGGIRFEHYGFQVRVRGADHSTGHPKARAIALAFDEQVERTTVTIGSHTYVVHSIDRQDVSDLSKDVPSTRRSVFTFNGMAAIRQTS